MQTRITQGKIDIWRFFLKYAWEFQGNLEKHTEIRSSQFTINP